MFFDLIFKLFTECENDFDGLGLLFFLKNRCILFLKFNEWLERDNDNDISLNFLPFNLFINFLAFDDLSTIKIA